MFKSQNLLITGGTGSFGTAVLKKFLKTDIGEIRIFSRDEKKQDDMRRVFRDSRVKFYLGDVRDPQSIKSAISGVDFIFHAAALKQVPSCEFFPMEAVKTNIIGTDNLLAAAIEEGVRKVICLSTDKAAYPVNSMGTSKAMMEKVFVARSRVSQETIICGTRYGNVMYSRGSVIPLFIEQIKAGLPITITDPNMTRYIMSLDEAVGLVEFSFEHSRAGEIMVQKSPACTILNLAQALLELFGVKREIKNIGVRHGEKLYEVLLTREEFACAKDMGNYYCIPADTRDLNYDKYFTEGDKQYAITDEYNSNNTQMLNVEEIKQKLLELEEVRQELATWKK